MSSPVKQLILDHLDSERDQVADPTLVTIDDPERLRAELIQVAAVAANWAECLDRNAGDVS